MVRKSNASNEDTKLLIQFYQDVLALEKEKLSDSQAAGYRAKIQTLEAQVEFNEKFVRYTKPLK